ncbi:MAG: hypothetical protein ACE14W_09610 [Candidatus Velamenicoccus archaeovorus]
MTFEQEQPVLRGTQVAPRGRRQRTAGNGRICAERGCSTVLSIYNQGGTCWRHTEARVYHMRGRRSRGRAA